MTPEQENDLRAEAEAAGLDADATVAAAKRLESATEPEPGKSDVATESKSQAAPGGTANAESGAKAHGGRGYFAYEYSVLTVNEIRASLFLEPVSDGSLYYNEWVAKHSGASTTPAAADATASEAP
jgi:hypothetical protein